MTDRVAVTPGSGDYVLTDQVTDGVLGQGQAQVVKIFDGTLDSVNKWIIDSSGRGLVYIGGVAAGAVFPVAPATFATETETRIVSSATSVQLLAANAARKALFIYNEPTAPVLYVKFGTTASTTSYRFQLQPGESYEAPGAMIYTGRIDGIWTSAVGGAGVVVSEG